VINADLTKRMTEWVTLQVLMHHRRQRAYDGQQRARTWLELRQPAAREVRVGIMGLGVLGSDAAEVLIRLGYQVAGWRRTAAEIPGMPVFHGPEQLDAFLARTDILVSLLPLTPETRGLLAIPLFEKLAQDGALGGPVLINGGRGGSQVESDIVTALDRRVLLGASLDVFEREPLDPASPLWGRDDVIITPHAAAWSDPAPLALAMLEQIAAFERGEPLRNAIDRAALY
jgi:glyoxylate/hydroxypyruvate reductase A